MKSKQKTDIKSAQQNDPSGTVLMRDLFSSFLKFCTKYTINGQHFWSSLLLVRFGTFAKELLGERGARGSRVQQDF